MIIKDWIKDLKLGDKVIFNRRFLKKIGIVEKITSGGNIKVCGVLFNQDGTQRGGDMWDRAYLTQATPEIITEIRENNIIARAKTLMRETSDITLEQAKSIIVLLTPTNNSEL